MGVGRDGSRTGAVVSQSRSESAQAEEGGSTWAGRAPARRGCNHVAVVVAVVSGSGSGDGRLVICRGIDQIST